MSLGNKAVSGLLWTFGQQFGTQLITFVTSIILARILDPSDFGLIGMLTLFMGLGNVLIDGGLTNSLIRTQDIDQTDYSSVFFINVIGSILIYLVIFFCAPYIALFYHKPILINIIRVYTISFIISSLATVQTTKLTRDFKFKLQLLMQLPAIIVSGIVGVFLAMRGLGVWSLVWMNIVNSVVFVSLHWIFSGWYPKWLIDKNKLKKHFNFGYKLTFSGALDILFENIYNIVIGRYFLATSLGYYTRAQTISMLPVQSISGALNKVTFSLFSTIQDDDVRLKKAYKQIMLVVIFGVTMIMVCLQAVAEPLFRVLLTDKWAPAVPYFKILCIYSILYPLHLYNLNVLLVKGRSDLFLRLEIYKKVITAVGVLSVISFGIYGLLYFQIVFSIIAFFINTLYSGNLIGYGVKEQIKDIAPIFVVGIVAALSSWYVDTQWLNLYIFNDWLNILAGGGFCLFIYLILSYLFKMPAMFYTFQLISTLKNDSSN